GSTNEGDDSGGGSTNEGDDQVSDDEQDSDEQDSSGSGDTGTMPEEDNDGKQDEQTTPENQDQQQQDQQETTPSAPSTPLSPPTNPPSYTPTTDADQKEKDKNKSLDERKTTLNPGEVPTGYDQTLGYNGTNEQLIANQNIVSGLSLTRDSFRFYTIDKDLAFAASPQSVYEEMKNASRPVGSLQENDALYVLSEEKDGWLYVESANVRGFVKDSKVHRDEAAKEILSELDEKLAMLSDLSGQDSGIEAEDILRFATETIPAGENAAYSYKRCTTKSTVIDKQYAIAESDTPILETTSENSREIGHMYPGSLCYIIMQANDKWAFVESANVRGFTRLANLTTGKAAKKIVQSSGELSMQTAEEYISPSENKALYYTLNSVYDGASYNNIRSEIVQIAAECIGNPYVWGGNSLTYGADCSGFVKTLYSMFGYNLPRVADDQSRFGTQIPISDAAPGDLIFFASNGYVYHVALYAGDGMTIEAYSEERGIIATEIGNRDAVWATRIIED
ncbi:MAG: C40 family peptidase, partial [Eubacteriales bacterium]|nr:C40 family peptidase [Eubacteriales bacterium]